MTRKTVGYFEGTDSTLLTNLICNGYDTLPVSNGVDHHGKSAYLINDKEKYDLLVGYVHKLYHPDRLGLPYQRLFHICNTYGIPVLIEVPAALQEMARALMPEAPDIVEFLDPADILNRTMELLG
jgi:hypothetical protein